MRYSCVSGAFSVCVRSVSGRPLLTMFVEFPLCHMTMDVNKPIAKSATRAANRLPDQFIELYAR